ncbi:hypothetical protein AKJ52_01095 [candidate division MSBL1 archaeon SCGC-AAA382C18]|uniref:Cas12f1-like TNB domain-containing protein n=1 Tax=candidate division MSBL1 archaeon SCGC-AAA382C18 TaxID=1698281 RepID=A0A133VKS7_9EURY|nr:hypothetical protein AKJ52_01095 [candidate division MSBL1 archaeon SCGC-AAA382C18]
MLLFIKDVLVSVASPEKWLIIGSLDGFISMEVTFEVPVSSPTVKKESFLESISKKFPKMVQWFLTVFEKEGLDFREMNMNRARKVVKELCYPTRKRSSKYNCKGAVRFPHSHYYDTAITEAIQKWNSFLTWKEKTGTDKRFPCIKNYAPSLDSQMFDLDLENGWITINTGRGEKNVHIPITVPNKSHYKKLDEEKISSIRLKRKKTCFVFLLIQKSSSPVASSPSDLGERPVLGIDLGERNLASLVAIRPSSQQTEIIEADFFDGARAKEIEHKENGIRTKLQEEGKSSEIPKRGEKSSNWKKDLCEKIACEIKEIAERLEAIAVFIGDLKAPRPRNYGTLSRRLNNYPFSRLKNAIKRHLEKADIFVELIYEGKTREEDLGTSQKCHKCGSRGERHKGGFSCPDCGLGDYNDDLNASINIAERGTKLLGKSEELGAVP